MRLFKDRSKECFLEGNRDGGSLKGEVDDGGEYAEQGWVALTEEGCWDGMKTARFDRGLGDKFLEG